MDLIKSVSAFTRLSDQVTVQQLREWAEDLSHVLRARFATPRYTSLHDFVFPSVSRNTFLSGVEN